MKAHVSQRTDLLNGLMKVVFFPINGKSHDDEIVDIYPIDRWHDFIQGQAVELDVNGDGEIEVTLIQAVSCKRQRRSPDFSLTGRSNAEIMRMIS